MAKDPKDDLIRGLDEAVRLAGKDRITTSNAAMWLRSKFTDLLKVKDHKGLNKSSDITNNRFPKEIEQGKVATRINARSMGRMMMFVYDPKTKEKLPYYDAFPLVLIVDMKPDGFVGLNLHYVPPLVRMKILEALVQNIDRKHMESGFLERTIEAKQIIKNYKVLYETTKIKALQPCFKRYLFGHVRSSFMFIDPNEWSKAVLLPVENFKKASKSKVWADSAAASNKKPVNANKNVVKTASTVKSAVELSTSNKKKSIFE